MTSLYGLTKPYDFSRAFPFLTAVFLVLVAVLVMVVAAGFGKLGWGTLRFAYLAYIVSIAAAAAVLSFAPRWSWWLIALCFVELSLGLGTGLLSKIHLARLSLLPMNEKLGALEQFRFHPLLQVAPTKNFRRELPFEIEHDSMGLRGRQRDRRRLTQQIVVATVGGSSTYDIALANGQTWSDVLERKLGSAYAVLNHGVPGYSTTENLIQTIFYLNSYDVRPQCAVYYIGWNDIRNAYLPHLDPAYADYHLLAREQDVQIRNLPLVAKISPLARILVPLFRHLVTSTPLPENFADRPPGHGRDTRLEEIYRAHIEAIVAINEKRGTTTILVGQVLNRAKSWQTTRRRRWFPLIRDIDVWPLQAHFNDILKDTAQMLHVAFLVPPIDKFEDADFVDRGHFTPRGAEKFAAMLVPAVRANCRK
jgi:lysophospholipase L1-like esterase